MAYGHAERNLALLRQLEAETRQLQQMTGDARRPRRSSMNEKKSHGPFGKIMFF